MGDSAGELRTRSQKCSYGRMTRVYEFLICAESPGMPVYPRMRPKSAHLLFRVTFEDDRQPTHQIHARRNLTSS
jgi:hypothetical protein